MAPDPRNAPSDLDEPTPATTPVDTEAQEEAGKVREESGGYD